MTNVELVPTSAPAADLDRLRDLADRQPQCVTPLCLQQGRQPSPAGDARDHCVHRGPGGFNRPGLGIYADTADSR